jgi:DNA polymerase I-like protein with 3'-5' exonuclease and polymerase domains
LAINEATRTNKIRLWSGRTRHFAGIEHKRRTALNVLIQGGVTECLREATVRAWHKFPDVRLSLTVHDSNVGDIPKGSAKEIWPELRKCLSDFPWMNPCLDFDMKVGHSWASAKKVAA